jgi:hypothetical protein
MGGKERYDYETMWNVTEKELGGWKVKKNRLDNGN